ncbi:hypothetical protein [Deinococcus daejeonensis]|uniref:Uncharacterized protein n=1 Tax=Deinococcus daejeonensis TaxID=1007098 RepID=A0ABQ2IY63_9DEIO|nr:hypothetical protein [Deinococcus daejeonensis]GGN32404.1 hypothetical protein GCM10010842_09050 [Deinococcus daejeonensis]
MSLSPRLQMATQIAAALAVAPATPGTACCPGTPAGPDREARHIASHALEITDALLSRVHEGASVATDPYRCACGREKNALLPRCQHCTDQLLADSVNPGDERAIHNARTG